MDNRISNEELNRLADSCFPLNTGERVAISKNLLDSICKELIQKREDQDKLIELLRKADDYSDRLEWKIFMNELPDITDKIMAKRIKDDGGIENE